MALAATLPVALSARESDSREPGPAAARLYAPESPLNTAIVAGAVVDAASKTMIELLMREIADKGWPVASREYSMPLFRARPATRRYDVRITSRGRTARAIPVPDGAFPAPGSDRHMTVIDPASRCEFDFYRASKRSGRWQAENFNALPTGGSGIYPRGLGTRGSGFANAAGLITAQDLRAGRIEHALVFSMRNTKAGGPVAPATSSDGESTLAGAIPEGARLQLDPALDLSSLRLDPWQRVVARALQKYGMYLADTGGAVALYAQHPGSASGYRYPWGDAKYAYMPPSLASRLRVLRLPRQRPSVHRFVPNACIRLR